MRTSRRIGSWIAALILASCVVEVGANLDNIDLLDSGWCFRRSNEVELLAAATMVKELAKPWVKQGNQMLADHNDERWRTKGGLFKRLSRVVNLASGVQEAVIHDLMYKKRCGQCGEESTYCS